MGEEDLDVSETPAFVKALVISFLVGALLEQTIGNSFKIPCPILRKSLFIMSYKVGLSAGLRTRIFRMRLLASAGTCMDFGIKY